MSHSERKQEHLAASLRFLFCPSAIFRIPRDLRYGQKIYIASAFTQISQKAIRRATHITSASTPSPSSTGQSNRTGLNSRLKIFCLRARNDEFDAFLGVGINKDLPDHRALFWEILQCQSTSWKDTYLISLWTGRRYLQTSSKESISQSFGPGMSADGRVRETSILCCCGGAMSTQVASKAVGAHGLVQRRRE